MKLTFLGQSAWGLSVTGSKVLIDPWPQNSEAKDAIDGFCDAHLSTVLVTHGGFDHLGIALDIVRDLPQTRLLADVAVHRHAGKLGLPDERLLVTGWNAERQLDDWHVRTLEVKHASVLETVGGEYLTGMPLAFVLWHASEPDVRVLHLGDTSIFSDLALFGQLYRPMVGLIGVGGGPGLVEMSPAEATLAALWLGVDVALPMHFSRDRGAAETFCAGVRYLPRRIETWVPEIGASYTIERQTRIGA